MTRSEDLFKRAQQVIPGGVNSPVRAFRAVGGTPRFIARAAGARLVDADGVELLDYVMSWGAVLLGHGDARVTEAIRAAASGGSSYGAPTEAEVLLAEGIAEMVPSIEQVRLVSSGTEAAMSALRLARATSGRSKIVKFAGCYHGHADPLLVDAGSGVATFGIPGTPGVTEGTAADTIVARFNDARAVEAIFSEAGDDIACVIVEPVAANMGVIPPRAGFLEALRALCDRHGSLLIFDEVITGFRIARGGAQELFGVTPDLTCLGKVIGGGLPIGAFGGPREVMEQLAPAGMVYQAGTLSGNPVAVAAGLVVLDAIGETNPYEAMEGRARALCDALGSIAAEHGVPVRVNRCGSLFSVFFSSKPVEDYPTARAQDSEAFARFFHGMLERGTYLPPSAFEAWFLSAAHTDDDIEQTIEAARAALR